MRRAGLAPVSRAWLLALVTVVLAGCPRDGDPTAVGGDDDGRPPEDPTPAECVINSDCAAAASSCCECPAFALPTIERWGMSCEDVECPVAETECPAVMAVCAEGNCTLACAPRVCELVCDSGFALDAAGCATCACAEAPAAQVPECLVDTDCVRVAADCCGCARGGADTAVEASRAGPFVDALGCEGDDGCPEVDVCSPDDEVRCITGTCTLAPSADDPGVVPPGACGRPDLAPCPPGTACVLNQDASLPQLGTCA